MTKLSPEEYKRFIDEMKTFEAQRLVKFQQHLMDNNHIMSDEYAKELLSIVEDFLETEGSWVRA
jgi:hypothetical protein